jgi:hypothetical protein
MKKERNVRRFFDANDMTIHSLRRGKHWFVTASKKGEDQIGRFILPVLTANWRVPKKLKSDIKRGGYPLHRT